MISYFQAVILGLLQGISELFPISSLGHSVIFPRLFGWDIHQGDPLFLTFLVATHTATALVLIGFFWNDWMDILRGMGRSFRDRAIASENIHAKVGWLLVVGTIPAGILGLLFQDSFAALFASAKIAAGVLILNGLILLGAENLRLRAPVTETTEGSDVRVARLSWRNALSVGASQAFALVPGMSRSGSSMAGGLLVGLSNEDAARYSFLLATPIIAAAAVLKLPELFTKENSGIVGPSIVGAVCAGITAYFSVRFLLRFFQTKRLTPFAFYCIVFGIASSVVLAFR